MATGIGGVSCDYVQGSVAEPTQRTEVWQIQGLDGYGAQIMGLGDSSFRFDVFKIDTNANVQTWYDNLKVLKGTVVSAEDDWGDTYAGLLVTDVSPPDKRTAVNTAVGSEALARVTISGIQCVT